MTTKFVFDFSGSTITTKYDTVDTTKIIGYDITDLKGGGRLPDRVELNVSCEFDVYNSTYGPPNNTSLFCQKVGDPNNNYTTSYMAQFILYANGSSGDKGRTGITIDNVSSRFLVDSNSVNYCHFVVTGYSCLKTGFYDVDHFRNKDNLKITSTQGSTTTYNVNLTCGTGNAAKKVPYNFVNSTPSFYPESSRLEFIPKDDVDFGCQYRGGDNYLAFGCNDDNTAVNAVQYKCGL